MRIENGPMNLLALALFGVSACQSGTEMSRASDDSLTPVCLECFESVSAARSSHPVTEVSQDEVIRTYECPCCETEMTVYIESGVHMVKCGGCAHDGVAWDLCTPVEMNMDTESDY